MKEIINETLAIILGDHKISYYVAGLFFSALAITLSLYIKGTLKYKSAKGTPDNFSWRFLLWDNSKRVVTSLILMFIFFRIFNMEDNVGLMIGLGFAVALSFEKLLNWLINKFDFMKFLETDRDKFKGK